MVKENDGILKNSSRSRIKSNENDSICGSAAATQQESDSRILGLNNGSLSIEEEFQITDSIPISLENFNNNENSEKNLRHEDVTPEVNSEKTKDLDKNLLQSIERNLSFSSNSTNNLIANNNFSNSSGVRRATAGSDVVYESNSRHTTPSRREENPFSFKHFLNCGTSGNINNISATNILGNSSSMTTTNLGLKNNTSNNNSSIISNSDKCGSTIISPTLPIPISEIISTSVNTFLTTKLTTSISYQSSTGTRPKVPQSTSNSSSVGGGIIQQIPSSSVSTTSMSSLLGGNASSGSEASKMKRSPRFSSFDSQASLAEYAAGGSNKDLSCVNENFLRDPSGILDDPGSTGIFPSQQQCDIERLQQSNQQKYVPRSFSNYDIDLPSSRGLNYKNSEIFSSSPSTVRRSSPSGTARPNRLSGIAITQSKNCQIGCNATRQNNDLASALPDFIQDNWIDPWYFNEMHLNSSPNSPREENLPIGMQNPPNIRNTNEPDKILPDFLSDGPIAHTSTSARLADVAAGLPDLDSPEDSPSLQLSRTRLENERLRRELDELRCSLAEQTRKANELESRLDGIHNSQLTYNHVLELNIDQVERNLDQSEKRTAVAQSQVLKLKQQVKQLSAEVQTLRGENDTLREIGAVGGNKGNNERIRRPSRTQQFSRELLRAASTAENNLRQLLTGVDNLRLMAASIDSIDDYYEAAAAAAGEEYSPLSDCDDFDDFGGGSGPAL